MPRFLQSRAGRFVILRTKAKHAASPDDEMPRDKKVSFCNEEDQFIMKKKLLLLCVAGLMAAFLAACSSGGSNAPATSAPEGSAPAAAAPETSAPEAAAPAAAPTNADALVIYSTHPEELLESISDQFTAETGIPVEFINLKGELADRVRSEKANPQADIMFGGDTATYMVLDQEGCFAESNPSWAANVDPAYKAANGHWYGTYRTPMVLFYNTEAIDAADAPADWADLADPKYKDQIVTRDAKSSSMRSTIAALIQSNMAKDGEEAAWNYIQALNDNIKNYFNSGSMMFQAIGKGEAGISMAVINDVFKNRDDNGMPLEMVIPASGAIVITDCVAPIANAPHPDAAAAFMEFIGSDACQIANANDFNRMPITDAVLAQCPEWMQTEFSALDVDWTAVSENQSAWLDKWATDYMNEDKQVASES